MVNITLKPTDQEVFLAEEPHAALLKLKCFQELNNKERLYICLRKIGICRTFSRTI